MTEPLPILILPSWLYHATQGGKIFRTQAELAEAEASGWRDSPAAAKAVEAFPVIDAAMPDDGVLGTLQAAVAEALAATIDDSIVGTLEAAEDAVEQGENGAIEEALEAAEDAIEQVQQVIRKKRKR